MVWLKQYCKLLATFVTTVRLGYNDLYQYLFVIAVKLYILSHTFGTIDIFKFSSL